MADQDRTCAQCGQNDDGPRVQLGDFYTKQLAQLHYDCVPKPLLDDMDDYAKYAAERANDGLKDKELADHLCAKFNIPTEKASV